MICPKCGSKKLKKTFEKGVQYKCEDCGYEGNVFEDLF
jgi:predicted RNA-binding Zn-ribbon protein involved in translation (DUF1610 family)